MVLNEVAVDRWLHRFIIGPKGANIKQITQDFPKVCTDKRCVFMVTEMN